MAYYILAEARICWQGDGAGPGMSLAPSAQSFKVTNVGGAAGGLVQVPGADAPTAANVTAAMATVGANLAAALNANLAQIQGWSTGGG